MATDWRERAVPVTVLVDGSTETVEETADGGSIAFGTVTRAAASNGHTEQVDGKDGSSGGDRIAFAGTARAFQTGSQQERRGLREGAMSFDERDGAHADELPTTDSN